MLLPPSLRPQAPCSPATMLVALAAESCDHSTPTPTVTAFPHMPKTCAHPCSLNLHTGCSLMDCSAHCVCTLGLTHNAACIHTAHATLSHDQAHTLTTQEASTYCPLNIHIHILPEGERCDTHTQIVTALKNKLQLPIFLTHWSFQGQVTFGVSQVDSRELRGRVGT